MEDYMKKLNTVLYTAQATSTHGREGTSKSNDGRLSVSLSTPKALGGQDGPGTNPEQLFAAGYSACFIGAIKFVAGTEKISLPQNVSIDAQVGIGPIDVGFGINAVLQINLPGMDATKANELVQKAHQVCPYSNATRGNIDVELIVKT